MDEESEDDDSGLEVDGDAAGPQANQALIETATQPFIEEAEEEEVLNIPASLQSAGPSEAQQKPIPHESGKSDDVSIRATCEPETSHGFVWLYLPGRYQSSVYSLHNVGRRPVLCSLKFCLFITVLKSLRSEHCTASLLSFD